MIGAAPRPRPAPDPRVLYCARSCAAVSNDAIWHRPRNGAGHWVINLLDARLLRAPEQRAVVDDFGDLVVVS
jgi:hypothetical protein